MKLTRGRNMIERRFGHCSVAVKNKLFVVGGCYGSGSETCEVYDSACEKFVYVKQKPNSMTFSFANIAETFAIGSKIFTLANLSATVICYDAEKGEWSEEPFEITEDRSYFGCAVVPKM